MTFLKDDLRRRTRALKERKYAIEERMKKAVASNSVYQIFREEIQAIIGNLQEEVKSSDSMTRKRLVQQLFERSKVFPNEGKSEKENPS